MNFDFICAFIIRCGSGNRILEFCKEGGRGVRKEEEEGEVEGERREVLGKRGMYGTGMKWSSHVELLDVRSSAVLRFDDSNLHDLDGGWTRPVPCSHVTIYRAIDSNKHSTKVRFNTCVCVGERMYRLTALGDSPSDSQVAVFPVHVVCPAP